MLVGDTRMPSFASSPQIRRWPSADSPARTGIPTRELQPRGSAGRAEPAPVATSDERAFDARAEASAASLDACHAMSAGGGTLLPPAAPDQPSGASAARPAGAGSRARGATPTARPRALLLTFTNKAAAEMKARALGVATVMSRRIQASTFHTFGLRVLRSHGRLVGIESDFEILDREDQETFAAEAAHAAGARAQRGRWSYLRLRREDVIDESVGAFGRAYEAAKRAARVVDFDDLIVYTADLLEQHGEIAEAYGTRFSHLLVDEFQDTNAAQFAIVKA